MNAIDPRPLPSPSEPPSPLQHWGGFVLGGAVAFCVDSLVLMLLMRLIGVPVLAARLIGIAVAMIASWLINRTITFPVAGKPTLSEFARFAAVAWTAAALNYAIFAVLVLMMPALHPVIAVAVAALFAMVVSYLGMRFGVFNR
jgi:putative flippase GtrA